MKCPKCHSLMQAGRASFREKASKFLRRLGRSDTLPHEVIFQEDDKEAQEIVPRLEGTAFHCAHCDTVVLLGGWTEELKCFQCGASIPESRDSCEACGWSWR